MIYLDARVHPLVYPVETLIPQLLIPRWYPSNSSHPIWKPTLNVVLRFCGTVPRKPLARLLNSIVHLIPMVLKGLGWCD